MSNELNDGFYDATARGPADYEQIEKGMLVKVPIRVNGLDETAVTLIGGEKEEKARAALAANGWSADKTWPKDGQTIRVQVKTGQYNGQPQRNIYISKPGGGGEKVEGTALDKWLAAEKRKLTGEKDPNGLPF